MSQLKRISLFAATAAIVAEQGLKNILISTLITVGTPVTTAGFVYEIVQMRHARLEREAEDRAGTAASQGTPSLDEAASGGASTKAPSPDAARTTTDLAHMLSAMLIARENFIDLYGGNPEAISPIYHKIAQAMLADDDRIFAKLAADKNQNPGPGADVLESEARLRVLHAQILALGDVTGATR